MIDRNRSAATVGRSSAPGVQARESYRSLI